MKKIAFLFIIVAMFLSACYQEINRKNRPNSPKVFYVEEHLNLSTEPKKPNTGDEYIEYQENPFVDVNEKPVSTFSIDADGASYSNLRRFIFDDKVLPPKGAIRTEELLNYFDLDYPYAKCNHPISLNGEITSCPWNKEHQLVRIGIKGKPLATKPVSNFVFLIDVSGSMGSEDKLELMKSGFKTFVDQLTEKDRVAIVTYAGSAGVVLSSTSGNEKRKIKNAINKLGSGGSTAGAQGIITAYDIAQQNFIEGGNNRIIIGTDGDFNVGVSDHESLIKLIEEKREFGIFITVLGVGRGNLMDGTLEQIANKGNGTYEYIDNVEQLRKVFIYDYSKFFTVAKDVKIQVKFDPKLVKSYRLIGYENRVLSKEDFDDDKKDAGEIGANQNITALYEIVPNKILGNDHPALTINFRYKLPDAQESSLISLGILDQGKHFNQSSGYMKFTAGISAFSMLLTDSKYKGTANYTTAATWIKQAKLKDEHGFKSQLLQVMKSASQLN